MYRDPKPPNHLLFQGDIIIAPFVTLRESNIQIFSNDGPQTANCPNCNTERPMPAIGACIECGEQIPPRGRRVRAVAARAADNEHPFEVRGTEQAVATVEVVAAIILSHSCDVDTKDQIRLAAVRGLADQRFNPNRTKIREGNANLYLHLPETDGLPEAAVCLAEVFMLPSRLLGERRTFTSPGRGPGQKALAPFAQVVDSRRTSLDTDGLKRLYQAQIRLDMRPDTLEFEFEPSPATFEDEQGRPTRDDLPTAPWAWPPPPWLR